MKRIVIAATLVLAAALNAYAGQIVDTTHHTVHAHRHARTHVAGHVRSVSDGSVTYNRDSPNPKIGWHTDSTGMRVCHNDCESPEIPGSGATCHDVTWMGMAMRECVTSN